MILAYVLAALVVVHVVGALRHHFAKKNDVIRRMTWNGSENVDGSEGLIAIPRMTHRVPVWLHRTFTAGTSARSASAHPTTEGGRAHVEPS